MLGSEERANALTDVRDRLDRQARKALTERSMSFATHRHHQKRGQVHGEGERWRGPITDAQQGPFMLRVLGLPGQAPDNARGSGTIRTPAVFRS